MTSEAEQKDLDATKAEISKEIHSNFELMRMYMSMNAEELRCSGQKSIEGALKDSMERTLKKQKEIWAKFLKKWPDK